MNQRHVERFWARVQKSDGCWEWTASRRGGRPGAEYGAFSVGRRSVSAHRFSWELHRGLVPEGLMVLHECDNPKCVRPDHLFLGTNLDNIDDMVKKERQSRGETHGMHRLTEADVLAARERYATGESVEDLARQLGVARVTMQQAITGRTWKHLPGLSKAQLRAAAKSNHAARTRRGEHHPNARVTGAMGDTMCAAYLRGEGTQRQVAARFGVSQKALQTALRTRGLPSRAA